jgi:MFS family permease
MHGLYLLWWVQERHVSPAVVAIILAAGDLTITALEVPTGWLADRYGHRVSLILGSALQIAGMLWCWLGEGIPGLLTASVLVALGDAFRSGADQALLYRSCVAINREADFQSIEARTRAATLGALVLELLAGGAIVRTFGFDAGWLIETIMSAAGLIIACMMTEPPAASSAVAVTSYSAGTDASRDRPVSSIALLAALIVPASWLGAAAGAAAFFAQTSVWATVDRATMLVAIVTLAEAAGAAIARRLTANLRSQLLLATGGMIMVTATAVQSAALMPVTVGLSFLVGIAEPLRATAIQRLSADRVRARAASIASACDKAAATIALIVAGALQRR